MTHDDAACRLESFIRERFQVPAHDSEFTRDANLWDQGYVDSSGLVEVLVFLEDSFDVRIPDELLFSPEFNCIDGIVGCLIRLKDGRSG